MENIKLIILTNKQILLSQIEEVGSELGEPDCKLNKPLLIDGDDLIGWFGEYTDQEEFMIHSDKILTIAEPKKNLIEKYESFKY